MVSIKINNVVHDVTGIDPKTPLLWYLRDQLGLTGTKFGCGLSMCGVCTVLMGDDAVRSCVTQLQDVGAPVTTIEGLAKDDNLHAVQKAWLEHQVPQCGYCQSGQIMLTVSLLKQNASPSPGEIDEFMSGNICRCGTYNEIRAAVKRAAEISSGGE